MKLSKTELLEFRATQAEIRAAQAEMALAQLKLEVLVAQIDPEDRIRREQVHVRHANATISEVMESNNRLRERLLSKYDVDLASQEVAIDDVTGEIKLLPKG